MANKSTTAHSGSRSTPQVSYSNMAWDTVKSLLCFQGIFLNFLGVVEETTLKTGRVNHTNKSTAFVFLFSLRLVNL